MTNSETDGFHGERVSMVCFIRHRMLLVNPVAPNWCGSSVHGMDFRGMAP